MKDLKTFQESTPTKDWPEHWAILYHLLKPIKWDDLGNKVSSRELVENRRGRVKLVRAFVRGLMADLIDEWLEEEEHSELWKVIPRRNT